MPFNGSGTYTLPYNWNNDAANNINITAPRMQAQDQDEATALSDCVTRDGQSPWTANIPAGGFKITGLANGSASADSAAIGQVFQIANNLSEGTAATMRTNLGLGTSAIVDTGTSGATIPLLNGTNTWANAQTFSAAATFSSTVNKLTLTAPATGATFTLTDGKTLAVTNTLTLSGTDSTVMTFPGTTGTVATIAATQTLTNKTISGSSNTLSNIAIASLASIAAKTVLANVTSGSAAPTAQSIAYSVASGGYFTLPGGIIVQWCNGTTDPANNSSVTQSISFPITFPNALFQVFACIQTSAADGGCDCWYQVYSQSASSCSVMRQVSANASNSSTTVPIISAVGN